MMSTDSYFIAVTGLTSGAAIVSYLPPFTTTVLSLVLLLLAAYAAALATTTMIGSHAGFRAAVSGVRVDAGRTGRTVTMVSRATIVALLTMLTLIVVATVDDTGTMPDRLISAITTVPVAVAWWVIYRRHWLDGFAFGATCRRMLDAGR